MTPTPVNENGTLVLHAEKGMYLTDGTSIGTVVRLGAQADPEAWRLITEEEKIEIHLHSIIYALLEEIEGAMKGMMKPVEKEVVLGQCEVRSIFKASKIGTIAGCYVTDGIIKRDAKIRLIRDGVVIYTGKISSLKRFKDDVKVVNKEFECGLTIENYNDEKENDIIEAYEIQLVERK